MSEETERLLRQALQARREKRLADGRRHLLEAAELPRREGVSGELAQTLRLLGEIERGLPYRDAARQHDEEAVAVLSELNEPLKLAHTL